MHELDKTGLEAAHQAYDDAPHREHREALHDAISAYLSATSAGVTEEQTPRAHEMARPNWQTMNSAPKDGTHILAVLHRAACADMDGIRRKAFAEIREIWYRPYTQFGMNLPWHAGDPFDSHDGMAPEHMGENIPICWVPCPTFRAPTNLGGKNDKN